MTKSSKGGSSASSASSSPSDNSQNPATEDGSSQRSTTKNNLAQKGKNVDSDRDATVHPSSATSKKRSMNAIESKKPSKAAKTSSSSPSTTSENSAGTDGGYTASASDGAANGHTTSDKKGHQEVDEQRQKRLELNRKAAKLSRQRRKERIKELEETAMKLRKENNELKVINETLRNIISTRSADQATLEKLQAENAELQRTIVEYQQPAGYDVQGSSMVRRPTAINHSIMNPSTDDSNQSGIRSPRSFPYIQSNGYLPPPHSGVPAAYPTNRGYSTQPPPSGPPIAFAPNGHMNGNGMTYGETVNEGHPHQQHGMMPMVPRHSSDKRWRN